MADKKKKFSNTEEEYNDALATADPTKIDNKDLEKLAKEAMKKFKSLSQIDDVKMIFFGSKEKPEDLIYQAMSRLKKKSAQSSYSTIQPSSKTRTKKSRGISHQVDCLD